ncbi:MAG: tRNA 2-thiouridine(34) synthase MnmA [Actinomycetales bacterium]
MKVLVAMSGGVDSSVAAARMVDAGHEVVGVHLALAPKSTGAGGSKGCCTIEDARDARRVADRLGIAFYVWDMAAEFRAAVIDDFLDAYQAGRTPNPCMRCNERIKFAAVLDRALALDFDAVATGHYARIVAGPDGPQLLRGVDPLKDQSYVLGMLQADQLARTLLPLGHDEKSVVRAEAEQRGLLVAAKPDSHDICFIPDGDTAGFLRRRLDLQPGPIIDVESGEQIGTHHGASTYTIGQRRGLGHATAGERRYVVDVVLQSREHAGADVVLTGPPTLLDVNALYGGSVTWTNRPLVDQECTAQVRAHAAAVPASAHFDAAVGELVVRLHEPIRGVAPGQSVVLYQGDQVLGSAIIERTETVHAVGSRSGD